MGNLWVPRVGPLKLPGCYVIAIRSDKFDSVRHGISRFIQIGQSNSLYVRLYQFQRAASGRYGHSEGTRFYEYRKQHNLSTFDLESYWHHEIDQMCLEVQMFRNYKSKHAGRLPLLNRDDEARGSGCGCHYPIKMFAVQFPWE
jgi:hypothetical protein